MPKLHEVIAVRDDRKHAATKFISEATTTFSKRGDHFDAERSVFEPISEDYSNEITELKNTDMVTTVRDKLDFVEKGVVNFLDVLFQQESANTDAKANIIIDTDDGGEIELIKDVPAVYLIQLEGYLDELMKMYAAIPTLDPKISWVADDTTPNVWRQSKPIESQKTKMTMKPIVMYPATEQHPAQTQLIKENIYIGKTVKTASTGRFSPRQKSEILGRFDRLLEAVKKARSRANSAEAPKKKIGKAIFNYLNGIET